MSINSLTNAAAARRPDTLPLNDVPKDAGEIAAAANTPPTAGPKPTETLANQKNAVETALNVLFGYIPTEVITLYVAVISAIQSGPKPTQGEWNAFIAFAVATPIVVWLVYGAKLKQASKPLPTAYGAWPVWEMAAATIAFVAWSFALPRSPFAAYDWYSAALSGVVVLIVSTLLGLVAPFFQRPLAQ
ncbi:hypothetical protein [Candidatus Accumulibacter cognatus]|nr:hypothetical protein [Candidatus Accumulibacter cognatus]